MKPEPIISTHLLSLGGNRNAQTVVLNLLPLAALLLENARQNLKVPKLDGDLRSHIARLVDRIFVLSDQVKSRRKCKNYDHQAIALLIVL